MVPTSESRFEGRRIRHDGQRLFNVAGLNRNVERRRRIDLDQKSFPLGCLEARSRNANVVSTHLHVGNSVGSGRVGRRFVERAGFDSVATMLAPWTTPPDESRIVPEIVPRSDCAPYLTCQEREPKTNSMVDKQKCVLRITPPQHRHLVNICTPTRP